MADLPRRRWPALDITLRAAPTLPHASGPKVDADVDVEGHLLAFLDDHAPTAIAAPPGDEEGWLVTASHNATPAWLAGPGDTQASTPHAWRVFFGSTDARDAARTALAASTWATRVDVATVDVEDEGWAERSQATLRAVQVGRLIIAPPWDANPAPLLVIIEPSMGFGTGHHESTRLCLHALQAIDLAGRRVLDLGTGSGVLAIAAALLGAALVLGVDDDRDAVDAARHNVHLNGFGARVRVEQADITTLSSPQAADVVLANLTGALLMRHATSIVRQVARGGMLIVSGFTADERYAVAHAFRDLRLVRDDHENGWVSLTFGT